MEAKSVTPQSSMVLVVGAGPTGLTAALELSRLQIPVRIIEKLAKPVTTSRAVGVQSRTLELFEQRGLIQSMLQKGNPSVTASYYGQGKRLFQLHFSHNGSSDYGYALMISQAETESVLSNAIQKQGLTIEREVEFVAFSQSERDSGQAVNAILKHRDGRLEQFSCAYIIDAEGAHSTCRTTLAVQFKGKTIDALYATADVRIEGDLSETETHIFSSEGSIMGIFPLGEGRFRLVASNLLSSQTQIGAPSLEELQKIYDQRSHIPARIYDLSWSSWFRINSRMVDRLRVGRAFFGGDSAHIHSPAGGQGLNTGIQDMINLAWKLAFVLKGQADPKLLDTYSDDRIPVIRDVLSRTEGITDTVGSKNKTFRWAFGLIGPWIVSTQFVQYSISNTLSQLALNYRLSPLSVSHGKKSSGREVQAGDRIPNVKVEVLLIGKEAESTNETESHLESIFSVLSTDQFTLLLANLADSDATHGSVESTIARWKPLLQIRDVAHAPGQEEPFRRVFGSQSSLILVRPDGYAAFVGTEQSLQALEQYLNSWFPIQKPTNQNS